MIALVASTDAKHRRGQMKNKRSMTPNASPVPLCGGDVTHQMMGGMRTKAPSVTPVTPEDFKDFTSSFYVVYGGPSSIYQGDAVSNVQVIVRDTYNDVVGCDADVFLDNVTIADQTLFVADSTRHNRHLARSFTLVNYYTVSGRCRACATGSKLFNDAVRRRLQTAADNFNSAGLMNLNAAGFDEITSVAASNGAPLTEAPTARPTNTPTSLPTISPTTAPSYQPSLQPSSYPSETPSFQPTLVPTTRPTRRPTRFRASRTPTLRPVVVPTSRPTRRPTRWRATRTPTRSPTSIPAAGLPSTSRANQIAAAMDDNSVTMTFSWNI